MFEKKIKKWLISNVQSKVLNFGSAAAKSGQGVGGDQDPLSSILKGPQSAQDAANRFEKACYDARKAWHQTNLLAMTSQMTVAQVKQQLMSGDAAAITDLLLEVMGPVAPIDPRDAMGTSSLGHRKMAGLVCLMAMRITVASSGSHRMPDLGRVKSMLMGWIREGDFGEVDPSSARWGQDAQKMAAIFDAEESPFGVRLAIVAPLAPALESMIVISSLSDVVVDLMKKTAKKIKDMEAKMAPELNALNDDEGFNSFENGVYDVNSNDIQFKKKHAYSDMPASNDEVNGVEFVPEINPLAFMARDLSLKAVSMSARRA
jgi:hypothetical protein